MNTRAMLTSFFIFEHEYVDIDPTILELIKLKMAFEGQALNLGDKFVEISMKHEDGKISMEIDMEELHHVDFEIEGTFEQYTDILKKYDEEDNIKELEQIQKERFTTYLKMRLLKTIQNAVG